MMSDIAGISKAPVYLTDRAPLTARIRYDFHDYGFSIAACANDLFVHYSDGH